MCIFAAFFSYIYINLNPMRILDELLDFVGMIKIIIQIKKYDSYSTMSTCFFMIKM